MGITFEWTFRAGDLLTLIGGVAVAMAFLYRRGGDDIRVQLTLEAMSKELAEMKTEFKTFGATLAKVALQEVQIALLMKWYDELRHGVGIVKEVPPQN